MGLGKEGERFRDRKRWVYSTKENGSGIGRYGRLEYERKMAQLNRKRLAKIEMDRFRVRRRMVQS